MVLRRRTGSIDAAYNAGYWDGLGDRLIVTDKMVERGLKRYEALADAEDPEILDALEFDSWERHVVHEVLGAALGAPDA